MICTVNISIILMQFNQELCAEKKKVNSKFHDDGTVVQEKRQLNVCDMHKKCIFKENFQSKN